MVPAMTYTIGVSRNIRRWDNHSPHTGSGDSPVSDDGRELRKLLGTFTYTQAKAFQVTCEYEKGVDHLTNAIAVCGQPQQLLQVLQQTLPPPVFQMLLTKLPTISQSHFSARRMHICLRFHVKNNFCSVSARVAVAQLREIAAAWKAVKTDSREELSGDVGDVRIMKPCSRN
ncbi:hypothetical protein P7K49_035448 [Saguinus oedipus]|uniref:Mitochondrial import receptor subunit TOM20 homolog n=1 Tax=Saguinus oedipus TaxID=9490 RepID=A0ABQ9TMR5_SAGOE|nr:hypothetical protein P7K49_035448 [Saguinus oedipus]